MNLPVDDPYEQWHSPMCVVVLDTQTGERRESTEWSAYWWAEGNGSCDCNRDILFDGDGSDGMCLGCHRYLIVESERESLIDLNSDYPKELLQKHGIIK